MNVFGTMCVYHIDTYNCICNWNKSTKIPVSTKTIEAHFPQLWGYVDQTHIHTHLGTYTDVSMYVYVYMCECIHTAKDAKRVLFPPWSPTFAPQLPAFHLYEALFVFVHTYFFFLQYFVIFFVRLFSCSSSFVPKMAVFVFATQRELAPCVCMYVCSFFRFLNIHSVLLAGFALCCCWGRHYAGSVVEAIQILLQYCTLFFLFF